MRATLCALLVMTSFATGCAQLSASAPGRSAAQNVDAAWCAANSLLRLSEAEIVQLPRPALEAAVAHNEKGIKLCGWRA